MYWKGALSPSQSLFETEQPQLSHPAFTGEVLQFSLILVALGMLQQFVSFVGWAPRAGCRTVSAAPLSLVSANLQRVTSIPLSVSLTKMLNSVSPRYPAEEEC